MLSIAQIKKRRWLLNDSNVEGSDRDLFKVLSRYLLEGLRTITETLGWKAGHRDEIWTRDLLNMKRKQKCLPFDCDFRSRI
jgi:hypothetical protein